ncbi:unnamed protein product [Thelazia callipaeda]|uniref:PPM-type phosphatase domain-containing protein n=1 Tax=Thelazia callipaeda TaxID=103827 RepID=A0A0N5CYP2_THECL|nr:unnamed protein product [Thelazia callipaeda]
MDQVCEMGLKESQINEVSLLVKKYVETIPKNEGRSTVRFRLPYQETSGHDARGDAVALVVEHLQPWGFSNSASYTLAYSFVDKYAKELKTSEVPFDENYYCAIDASVWCPDVIHYLDIYLKNLADNLDLLPKFETNSDDLLYSYYAHKNRRPKMEDRAVILPSLCVIEPAKGDTRKEDSFFAVFDGHNGIDCANYASSHFAKCLVETTHYADGQIEEIMKEAFTNLDKRLTARCKNDNIKGGTTAVCAFLRDRKYLCLGWCGDSSAAVLRKDGVRTLSSTHSPDVPAEVRRVEEAGGIVLSVMGELRVNGVLNITRALGDIDGKPVISSEPDVMSFRLDNSEYLLLLSCDGVWETFNESDIYGHIVHFVRNNSVDNYEKLAEFIVDQARESGTSDNLTMICVFLRPVKDLWELFANES